jgi:hypothetical protein
MIKLLFLEEKLKTMARIVDFISWRQQILQNPQVS